MDLTNEERLLLTNPRARHTKKLAVIDAMFARSCKLEALEAIQSHFSCPEECEGICCKREKVQILESDFRRLKAAQPDIRVTCMGEAIPGIKGFELDLHCQYLNQENRCSVYEARPQTCRMYPFRFVEGDSSARGLWGINPEDYLSLDICPMSLKIMEQYIIFYSEFLDATDADEDFKEAEIRNMEGGMEVYRKGIANFRKTEIKNCVALLLDLMPPFAEWLNHYYKGE